MRARSRSPSRFAILAMAGATLAACSRPRPAPPASVTVDARGCASGVPTLAPEVIRGMSFAHAYQHGGERGYGSPSAGEMRAELREHGVEWLAITPFAFQRGLGDDEVRSSASMAEGESLARVRAEIRAAHAEGLSVLLKPHVWVGNGEWCGRIAPVGEGAVARWWGSYGRFVLEWATLAAEERVELLAIGTELGSMVRADPALAVDLVDAVRLVYPGKLVYAANWDELDQVPFWQRLDFVGMQLYAPLAERAGETDEAMERRLGVRLDAALAIAREAGKPLVLTEVGYTATESTLRTPHAWPEALAGVARDDATQARAYRTAFRAIGARPTIAGVFVWKWFTDPDSREEGSIGFSPRGRPAAAVLASAYGARRCR